LPWTSSVDLLIRRSLRLGGASGGIYLDLRNLLNRRNVVAVRRDTGVPQPTEEAILLIAEDAYAAHPETIPYESAAVPAPTSTGTVTCPVGTNSSSMRRRPVTTPNRCSPTGRRDSPASVELF
jgi:hypothetical protein